MKKPCLLVHKGGFSSVYAVIFLMIVTSFTMVIVLQTIAYVKTQKNDRSLHYAQLFSIYHAVSMLEHYDALQEKPFTIKEEVLMFDQYEIRFSYMEDHIMVQYENVFFSLLFNKETSEIINLAYLS